MSMIEETRSEFFLLFRRTKEKLRSFNAEQLRDLSHRCQSNKLAPEASLRIASELVGAACEILLEEKERIRETGDNRA